jgi:hypothetical protein
MFSNKKRILELGNTSIEATSKKKNKITLPDEDGELIVQPINKLVVNVIESNSGIDLNINSALNKNIIIDALGTGKILLNTVQNAGCVITTSQDNPLYITKDINNYESMVIGVSSNNTPFLFQLREGVEIRALRLGAPGSPVIIGDNTTSSSVFNEALYISGSVELTGGVKLINGSFKNLLASTVLTSNKTQTFQDKTGTVALISDILPEQFQSGSMDQVFHILNPVSAELEVGVAFLVNSSTYPITDWIISYYNGGGTLTGLSDTLTFTIKRQDGTVMISSTFTVFTLPLGYLTKTIPNTYGPYFQEPIILTADFNSPNPINTLGISAKCLTVKRY